MHAYICWKDVQDQYGTPRSSSSLGPRLEVLDAGFLVTLAWRDGSHGSRDEGLRGEGLLGFRGPWGCSFSEHLFPSAAI